MKPMDLIAEETVDSAYKIHEELGFLIHFNVPLIKSGIRRIANQFQES